MVLNRCLNQYKIMTDKRKNVFQVNHISCSEYKNSDILENCLSKTYDRIKNIRYTCLTYFNCFKTISKICFFKICQNFISRAKPTLNCKSWVRPVRSAAFRKNLIYTYYRHYKAIFSSTSSSSSRSGRGYFKMQATPVSLFNSSPEL